MDISKAIAIDGDFFWDYGGDEENPEVQLHLIDTIELDRCLDELRMKTGYLPMLSEGHEKYDDVGWYNYYVTISNIFGTGVADHIEGVVESDIAEDDLEWYEIPINEFEQRVVWNELDQQLKKYGTSCNGLLEEAKRLMVL